MMKVFYSTNFYRTILISFLLSCWFCYDAIGLLLDLLWEFLLSQCWFCSVFFETIWTVACYTLLLQLSGPGLLERFFSRFRISTTVEHPTKKPKKRIILEAVIYCGPLMLLDVVLVKKYPGVDPDIIQQHKAHIFQVYRPLPTSAPTPETIIFLLLGSLVLYDAAFFVIHALLHRSRWLYNTVHRVHHEHSPVLHSKITNQLSVLERLILILSANEALKLCRSHPLTRVIFVPVFVGLLVDNHCGYDLPWSLNRLLPQGWSLGPRGHADHHIKGTPNYQPFLCYLDRLLALVCGRHWPYTADTPSRKSGKPHLN